MRNYLLTEARSKQMTVKEFDWMIRSLQSFTKEEEIQIITEYKLSELSE